MQSVRCNKCQGVYLFSDTIFKTKQVNAQVEERVIECPYCKYQSHVCYMNAELKQMQKALAKNPTKAGQRRFKEKFEAFQLEMEAKSGPNPTPPT